MLRRASEIEHAIIVTSTASEILESGGMRAKIRNVMYEYIEDVSLSALIVGSKARAK